MIKPYLTFILLLLKFKCLKIYFWDAWLVRCSQTENSSKITSKEPAIFVFWQLNDIHVFKNYL